jgi:hypothetical protein
MPSDCQCSACGACDCQSTKIVEKRISNKVAIEMIEELEKENERLEKENKVLLEENKRKNIDKDEIIRQLMKKLEEL